MENVTCFFLGFVFVGLSIPLFDSILWGMIIGVLLGWILLLIDNISEVSKW